MITKTKKNIPQALLKRIPAYYRIVCEMESEGILRTTSEKIAEHLGNTSSQVRQDFYVCGGTDGYGTAELREWLERILGIKTKHRIVVVGVGNIGRAVMSFKEFNEKGFCIDAAFDSNLLLCGMEVCGIPIQSIALLENYLFENPVDIIVITTPADAAKRILAIAEGNKVRGVWNFAPVDLQSETVKIRNVHLSDSLLSLSFEIEENS